MTQDDADYITEMEALALELEAILGRRPTQEEISQAIRQEQELF